LAATPSFRPSQPVDTFRSMPTKAKARPRRRLRRETAAARRARVRKIVARLARAYPDATCALHHTSALELLVATILSAQSTDARVNMVTPALFTKYRTAHDYASADPHVLEQEIHSTGFFRNKTKSLIGMAQALVERHDGAVPATMDALVELPGVGRKTANVVLGTWFGKNEGIVVDTHVQRLSTLLGLTQETDPVKIERDLMALVPRERWTWWSHTLILHGRRVCIARRPKCEICVVNRWCPSSRV
jgi:endonuclease III